jgi:hypothetical protein
VRANKQPAQHLVLWGYDASPFVNLVKETLSELELPYKQVCGCVTHMCGATEVSTVLLVLVSCCCCSSDVAVGVLFGGGKCCPEFGV